MVLSELPQVLMWRETAKFEQAMQEIWVVYGNDPNDLDLPLKKVKDHLFGIIKTKEEFIQRVEDYAANATAQAH